MHSDKNQDGTMGQKMQKIYLKGIGFHRAMIKLMDVYLEQRIASVFSSYITGEWNGFKVLNSKEEY